jgi:hypothetical protein
MSQTIEGNFSVHRTKTVNGKDALLVIPERNGDVLTLDECDISFERVDDGNYPPDTYLTITNYDGVKIHLGPDIVVRPQ